MNFKEIYKELDYLKLLDVDQSNSIIETDEFRKIGIDKVYLSSEYPAIFFKEVDQFDIDTLANIAKIQHLAWNYKKVGFLIVFSTIEIRIYNCSAKPINYSLIDIDYSRELSRIEIIREDIDKLKVIKEIFSRTAVDCGLLWISDNPLKDKIDIRQRLDYFLVKSLLNAAKELKNLNIKDEIIHSLLMRSIFIMYLEDKGAAKETTLYDDIMPNAKSFLDILKDKKATYDLFHKLQNHFNGNIFPIYPNEEYKINKSHLDIVRKCLIDGDLSDNPKLFGDWKLFKFDVIQIELLSEIYENFLIEFKQSKKEKGQYYTPPPLVELILNDKLNTLKNVEWSFKVLDPACGSGIFLVESFKRLIKRWKNAHPNTQIEFNDLVEILVTNIYGIEIDRLSIRVATFSLYLAIVEHLNPKSLWLDKGRKFPNLINDKDDRTIDYQGNNLIRCDAISELSSYNLPKMDLVVGNPPFGANIKQNTIKEYCKKLDFGQDMVIPFLHKSINFVENGNIALIFNTKILTNTEKTYQNFRKWIFNKCYVEKIYNLSIFRKAPKMYGGQLFSSAVGPISIIYYKKNFPKKIAKTIEYWAPKTYVKNNLIEGVIIDSSDVKFLPRLECIKPDSKIWKIAMWGTVEDFNFIENLTKCELNLAELISKYKLKKGLGLQFLDNSTKSILVNDEINKYHYIPPSSIKRFYTPKNDFSRLEYGLTPKSKLLYEDYYKVKRGEKLRKISAFRRLGTKETFIGPHVLIKEGLSDKKLCASYLIENCSFNSKVFGLSGKNATILKAITAIFNSDFAFYYLFLISSSIGIEREEIKPNEIYNLPVKDNKIILNKLAEYVDSFIALTNSKYPFNIDARSIETKINIEVNKLYGFNERQQIFISDFVNHTVDLLFRGHKSIALKPTNATENLWYAETLRAELNVFLDSKVNIQVIKYELNQYSPLNMICLKINARNNEVITLNNKNLQTNLNAIDKYLISKKAPGIYVKKQLKYFDHSSIYLIKPNQKRYWSRTLAINDASELINEILKMD